jgi:D-cysteine desulfhydrase family pyridoxal phosphate-dependent enzyme
MKPSDLSELLESLHPLSLGYLNTPLAPMPRLSQHLGETEIWVKRDDLTGLATGGNKVRKLNYVLADALRHYPDPIVTAGAQQSNQARQAAAAAAMLGVNCTLVLGGSEPDGPPQGNYLIDRLVGADVVWAGERSVADALEEEAGNLRSQGRNPYVIPFGASNALGVCGYVQAMLEVMEQMQARDLYFDAMVVASGSGGMQAGLELGARLLGYRGRIIGISIILNAPELRSVVANLANDGANLLGVEIRILEDEIIVDDSFLGEGYGVIGEAEREALTLSASLEGLLLDPVYTGRQMAGLIDNMRNGAFASHEKILFWHSGGVPAIFTRASEII